MSHEFQRLDRRVQKWIYKQGWPDLRPIQKNALEPVLGGDRDVLISASTAAGKTEAAFLPAITACANQQEGIGILYISPLKALINDQYRRLETLCEMMDLPVTAWHGDASQSAKKSLRKKPLGLLLITPESLEAMLINHTGWARDAFKSTGYVIIDEFHAFIGTERGQHMLSLLNRLDHLTGRLSRPIPRVALSATLGNLESVPASLRPNSSLPCTLVTDEQANSLIKVQVRGYTNPKDIDVDNPPPSAEDRVCQSLYELCRGGSHLVFANSRARTENIASTLSDMCEREQVPNEFFPHHGSLSKELRHDLESRLQRESKPTTAVCTMTLELGIDIGKVDTVFQVTAPHSVSSLRQRLGRSGRRGNAAVLRMLITENEQTGDSSIVDKLRLQLVQSLAMVRLLINDKWFEPADTDQYHYSTLIHQVLATIGQWGGIRADQLYTLLCRQGPFTKITPEAFGKLLRHLGGLEMITQPSSGELILGVEGERLVGHYTFYAVFKTPDEYRLVNGARTLGTLPVDSLVLPNQHIVFAGKRWKVLDVDVDDKVIRVERAKGGKAPSFGGEGMGLHDVIREEMYRIYRDRDYRIQTEQGKIGFIDQEAEGLFSEGVEFFRSAGLDQKTIIESGSHTYVFSWLGDRSVNALSGVLIKGGFKANNIAGIVEIEGKEASAVEAYLVKALIEGLPTPTELAEFVPEKRVEKFDELLCESLLTEGYGQKMFDVEGARSWLERQFQNGNQEDVS
mgnify:CR=1 FL=1